MATMIPAVYAESTSSNAEKKVFNWLLKDKNTENWIVLHSLNLSVDTRRRYGEIDFVALIPDVGIVCLEIKGGGVRCEDGVWYSTGSDGVSHALKRSPFAQARANMFSLRDRLSAQFGAAHTACKLPIGFIAVYPDCRCPPESPEFTRAEVIDCDDLRHPISSSILRFASVKLGCPSPLSKLATPQVLKELRTFLRPDFDRGIARSATIADSEERIVVFTEEQLQRLDELDDNARCLFEGAAGTGKTLLALNLARARAAEGKRVLLICFNRLLGRWLAKEAENVPRLRAGSFFSTLRRLVLLSEFEKEYLQKEIAVSDASLYKLLSEYGRLAILQFEEHFDVLIVDEIQDLSTPSTLAVFNEWLAGGLANGHWAFFGDYTRQSIFNNAGNGPELIAGYDKFVTKSKLLNNCRNTRQIAESATALSGFEAFPYRSNMTDGAPVQYHYWKDRAEQEQELEKAVKLYFADGVLPSEMIILSPFRLQNSGLTAVTSVAGRSIVDVTENDSKESNNKAIKFCTVQAFKGMESPIVFMIDVESSSLKDNQSLIYVGLSRARSALHLFAQKSSRDVVNDLLSRSITGRKLK